MMHRRLVWIALLLLAFLGVGSSPAMAQTQVLRFLWFTDGPDKPAIEGLVKRFNDTNPDIKSSSPSSPSPN